jgi:hypothetical protein
MLPQITDDFMKEMRTTTKNYTLLILKLGPEFVLPGVEKIVWEHGRRNSSLGAAGLLSIVCPVNDGSGIAGIEIFNADLNEVKKIMDEDQYSPFSHRAIFDSPRFPSFFPLQCLQTDNHKQLPDNSIGPACRPVQRLSALTWRQLL